MQGFTNEEMWEVGSTGVRRGRGRSKKNWWEIIRLDTTHLQLTKRMALDGKVHRSMIKVEDLH